MIFGFLAILFWWLDKKDEYHNLTSICRGLSFGLVIPSLRASIINTYDYKNYGLVLGALIGLQTLGLYIGYNLWELFMNKEIRLATSTSFLIVSLVIFLIYGRTGVNLRK